MDRHFLPVEKLGEMGGAWPGDEKYTLVVWVWEVTTIPVFRPGESRAETGLEKIFLEKECFGVVQDVSVKSLKLGVMKDSFSISMAS